MHNFSLWSRLAFLSVSITTLSVPALLAQPVNNDCPNATVVTPGSYAGTTLTATNDAAGGCFSGTSKDVWYRIMATREGRIYASTCDGASWDTSLSIWSGCPTSGGTQLFCNDDACGVQSTVQVNSDAGVEYWIRVAGYGSYSGNFTVFIEELDRPAGSTVGPDVVYSEISGVAQYGPIGGVYAYAFGTGTCNIGDADLVWGNSWGGTPSVGFNAYRLHDGRLLQIGQSWCKTACCAAAGEGCNIGCNGMGGSVLGAGCKDVYSASYNASQSNLAMRSQINAFSGAHNITVGASGDVLAGRLKITAADLASASFPGALYFAEGVYVGSDDADAGNSVNNASYRRFTSAGSGNIAFTGTTEIGESAIYAWRDHGNGVGVPDPKVTIEPVDVPNEGRYIVASRPRDLGNGSYRYDYAVFNLSSNLAGGSFSVPFPVGTNVTNIGFHDVDYHSGEPYSNADWTASVTGSSITWSSPETFAPNPNSNALRWGTMYNFWFEADREPSDGEATLGMFRPEGAPWIQLPVSVPSAPGIAGDLDGDGDVDLSDLATLLGNFGCTADCAGDVDGDGDTDLSDLAALLGHFGE